MSLVQHSMLKPSAIGHQCKLAGHKLPLLYSLTHFDIFLAFYLSTLWINSIELFIKLYLMLKEFSYRNQCFVVCLLVLLGILLPYLTSLSSIMLIWAAGARCKWRAHLHNRISWQKLKPQTSQSLRNSLPLSHPTMLNNSFHYI